VHHVPDTCDRQHRAQRLERKPFLGKVRDRHRHDAQHFHHLPLAEFPELATKSSQGEEVAQRPRLRPRGTDRVGRLEEAHGPADELRERRPLRRVRRGGGTQAIDRSRDIGIDRDRRMIRA
jgi:hypothetical protein